jgi:hypothetical protein
VQSVHFLKDLFMSNTCAAMYEIVVVKFATIRVWIVLLHCLVSSNKPGVTTQIYCHSVDGSNSKALKDRPAVCLLNNRYVSASFYQQSFCLIIRHTGVTLRQINRPMTKYVCKYEQLDVGVKTLELYSCGTRLDYRFPYLLSRLRHFVVFLIYPRWIPG